MDRNKSSWYTRRSQVDDLCSSLKLMAAGLFPKLSSNPSSMNPVHRRTGTVGLGVAVTFFSRQSYTVPECPSFVTGI